MRHATARLPVLLPILLLACQEYNISKDPEIEGGESGEPDICEDREIKGEDIAADAACEMPPQTGAFTPALLWHLETFSEQPGSNSVMATTLVAHITDDDRDGTWGSAGDIPDIVFVTYGSADVLRVVSGDGSRVHWSKACSPQGQGAPAVGDLDHDKDPEILVVTNTPSVIAWHHDGTKMWESPTLSDGNWLFPTIYVAQYSSTVSLSDMNGDSYPEVIAGRAILDGRNGQILGIGAEGKGTSNAGGDVGTTSFAVDIDRDGDQEVVTGNALYDMHGNTLSKANQADGYVAVADFDGDPKGEIVVVRSGSVTLHDTDWRVLWGPTSFGSSMGGPPTVADFDGDGDPEIGVAGASIYAVLDTNGALLWSRTTQDGTSGVTGSAVYDFEGDGIAEVVYADELALWVFNGPDGAVKLQYTDHASNTWLENPVIADVDGDGHADIVLGHNPYQGGKNFYGISVISDADATWTATRSIWNQHAWYITNVADDGGVPATPDVNWDTYNNFRSGDLHAGQGSAAGNLVPEFVGTCTDSCDAGVAWIWGRLRNEGAASIPAGAVAVLVSQGAEVDRFELDRVLEPGRASAGHLFQVDVLALGDTVSLVADPEDALWECDETDNRVELGEPACP